MDVAGQIKKGRKEMGLSQQDVGDRLSMNRVQYNRIDTGKSDPTLNVLQRIAAVLAINVVEFFEADKVSTEVNSVNERFCKKFGYWKSLTNYKKTAICNMIDTAVANKHLKEVVINTMNITV